MSHPYSFPFDQHADHVETIGLVRPPVPSYPHRRRPSQLPLLCPSHRLDGITKLQPATRLHLDEGDHSPTFDDEIDIAMAAPESPLHDPPPFPPQPTLGDSLAQLSKLLPGR